LSLVSESIGIDNGAGVNNGATPSTFSSSAYKGITSQKAESVVLGGQDITQGNWTMQSGLVGEVLAVYTAAGAAKVSWSTNYQNAGPLSWYQVAFTAPATTFIQPGVEVNASLNLNALGLSRGRFFVNGFDLGRYWSKLCGSTYACQQYYSIPGDLLNEGPNANVLTILDLEGVADISLVDMQLSVLSPPPPCKTATQGSNISSVVCPASGQDGSARFTWTVINTNIGQFSLNSNPSLCIGDTGTDPVTNSPQVGLVTCDATDKTQQWKSSNGAYAQVSSGNCMDIPNQNPALSISLDIWACNGGSNQQFSYDASTGFISPALNGDCLGVCY
jgi:hypothetical protein